MSPKQKRRRPVQPPVPAETAETVAPGAPDPVGIRTRRLGMAAGLVALEGVALAVLGVFLLVDGIAGGAQSVGTAVTGGITVLALAALPLLAARGLYRCRAWSRGPALITQLMALPVAWTLCRSHGLLIPAGVVLAAVAVANLVFLFDSATTRVLGIRPPGSV